MKRRIKMVGVRRPPSALLAVSAFLLAACCSWPLLRSDPLIGAPALAVIAGYWYAAFLCAAATDPRAARWLVSCGLLWAGSITDAVPPLAVPAIVCWLALWTALAGGAVLLRSPVMMQAAVRGKLGGGLARRGIALTAGVSASIIALTSLVLAALANRWATQWWPGPARGGWAIAVQGLCAATVPIAVAVAAWRRRSARAGVSALLTQLASPPTVEGVQSALRAALSDPTAAVFYRLPGGSGFVSATGEPVDVPVSEPGQRLVFPVRAQSGEVAAMLSVDGSAHVDAGRVQIALIACGPALENARLQAVLHSHLHAARASRARIVQAAVAERRKLARDLHDGAQQHLYALLTSLGMARQKTSQPQAVAAIDAARDQLRVALSKLRGLGRELYPALLDSEGLTAALESLADDGPLDVDVVSQTGRQEPEVEIVMYLTVREILAGLAGHSAATQAAVALVAANDRLSLQVTSDGYLGDRAGIPAWLSVITDRVEADGGGVSVKWSPDQITALGGICVEAWIPCG